MCNHCVEPCLWAALLANSTSWFSHRGSELTEQPPKSLLVTNVWHTIINTKTYEHITKCGALDQQSRSLVSNIQELWAQARYWSRSCHFLIHLQKGSGWCSRWSHISRLLWSFCNLPVRRLEKKKHRQEEIYFIHPTQGKLLMLHTRYITNTHGTHAHAVIVGQVSWMRSSFQFLDHKWDWNQKLLPSKMLLLTKKKEGCRDRRWLLSWQDVQAHLMASGLV